MSTLLRTALLALAVPAVVAGQDTVPGAHWDRYSSPAVAGWDGAKLEAALAYADSIGSDAVLIVQNGRIVADWGATAARLNVFSVRKSLLNALIGIEIAAGRLRLESTLAELGIDDRPPLTAEEKRATVRDLLMARSGVYHAAAYETPGMARRRPARGSHAPGDFWFYNNWDFNALGTILEHAAGRSVFEDFAERIAGPIGMQDFRLSDTEYVQDSASVHPAYVFRMSARDLARFGLLYLYHGRWGHRQIVPAAWVKESTQPYTDNGILGGYGYLWWVALHGEHFPFVKLPDGTYSARGTGEQNLLVIPAWRLVIVHRTDVEGRGVANVPNVTQFGRLLSRILAARPAATP